MPEISTFPSARLRLSGEVNHIGFQPHEATCDYPTAQPASYSNTQADALLFKIGVNWHAN